MIKKNTKKTFKKVTVTIGIPAYNEEANIQRLLKSLVRQIGETVSIEEIFVISDGSKDKTVEKAKDIDDPRIKIFDDKLRTGKPIRVNQMITSFNNDVLVVIDADCVIDKDSFIEYLCKPFKQNPDLALVSSHVEPISAKSFLESAINNYRKSREIVKKDFNFCNTIYGMHRGFALSSKFAKKNLLPKNILNDDSYFYLKGFSLNYEIMHAEKAIIKYQSPKTLSDQIAQSKRHLVGGGQLYHYFDKNLVDKAFFVPTKILLKIMLVQMKLNFIGYLYLRLVNFYCMYKSTQNNMAYNAKWSEVKSAKI